MKMYPYLGIPTINNFSASHISSFTFVFKFFSSHIHYFYTMDRKELAEDQVNQVVQENRTGLAVESGRQGSREGYRHRQFCSCLKAVICHLHSFLLDPIQKHLLFLSFLVQLLA